MSQQVPPHDLAAENALLGALLLAPRQVMKQIGELDPQDFYDPGNRLVYSAIKDYLSTYPQENPQEGIAIPLAGILRDRGELDKVGGPPRLLQLQMDCPSRSGAPGYARRIRTEAGRFKLLKAAREQVKDAKEFKDLLQALVDAKTRLDEIVAHTDLGRALRTAEQSANSYLDTKEARELGEMAGIPTGFSEIDKALGGLRAGGSYVIGGRTGQGKTALALAFGLNALRQGHPVLFVSLEMSETLLVERIMANMADVTNTRLRDISPASPLNPDEEYRFQQAVTEYLKLPLTIHDDPDTTLSRIEGLARLRGIGDGRGLIIVDYLQLISSEPGASFGNRQEEVTLLSKGLVRIARSLDCAVVAPCQIRDATDGINPVPVLSDVRESRAINNDASAVLLVHRPGIDEEVDSGDFDVYIRKNRNGPGNRRVELLFNGAKMRFSERNSPGLKLVKHRPETTYKFGGDKPQNAGNVAADAQIRRRRQQQEGAQHNGPLD